MFVHVAKKTLFTESLQTQYANSIVFIKDTQEIWTHGTFYAIPDAYKNRITNLETAQAALKKIYSFGVVSDGTNTASATETARTLKFTGGGATNVTVDESGVTISTPIAAGTANGTIKVNGADLKVTGLNDAAYRTAKSFDDATAAAKSAADKAQATADTKVASVSAVTASAISVGGTATAPTVGLKLYNTGHNVSLTQTTNGLSADVEIPASKVDGVKSGDKVIALGADKMLTSTLGLAFDAKTKLLKITGIGGAEVATLDATAFVKDGMISQENTSFDPDTKVLTLGFNTDAGVQSFDIDLSSLVDTYDGANLKLTAASGMASGTSVDAAVKQLSTDVAAAKVSGVTSFGSKTGAITLKATGTNNGSVNLAMTNNELGASIVGLGSAAFTPASDYAKAADGLTISKGTVGNYIDLTISAKAANKQTVGASLTVQTVSSASSTAKGLAEANDVKNYVNDSFAWAEITA